MQPQDPSTTNSDITPEATPEPGKVIGADGSSTPSARPGHSSSQTPPPLAKTVRKLLLVTGSILLVVALASGFLLWQTLNDKREQKPATNTTTTQEAATDTEVLKCDKLASYQNQDIGFGFCYPSDWGAITVEDSKFEAADIGSRWRVNFADKPQVHLSLKSKDWSTQVGRDGTCSDLTADMPDASEFSNEWVTATEAGEVASATRGLKVSTGKYLIQEVTDNLLTSGVCLEGYTVIDSATYANTTATYSATFTEAVPTPQAHMDDTEQLIPAQDRSDFVTFVQSVVAL